MNYDPLNQALAGVSTPVYATSFADIQEGFREQYGARNWIGKLASVFTGGQTHGKEYGAARRSIERVASGQYKSFGKAEYRAGLIEAGKTLEPIRRDPPSSGIDIKIYFNDPTGGRNSRKEERVTPLLHLSHADAVMYMSQSQPDYTFLFNLWGERRIGDSLFGEEGAYPADIVAVVAS